ncbi:MAG TPA: hypothetical protein VF188_07080 [Longimicrobiales bacterium]
MNPDTASAGALLRHTVAALACCGGKAIRGAPDGFSDFRIGPGSRTLVEIVAGRVGAAQAAPRVEFA